MTVKLVSVTPDAEQTMAYIARVSNPSNQENENYAGLLRYCIKHNHWSVFEQSTMTLEIETTRAIAGLKILRHRSFTYQEFSQRYADSSLLADVIPLPELRRQDTKNRQNSIDDMDPFEVQILEKQMQTLFDSSMALYRQMLDRGVAKEARNVLPLCTPTRIYMTGSCRSWIHYISLRSANGTQKEHMKIAEEAKKVFIEQFPTVSEALEWV